MRDEFGELPDGWHWGLNSERDNAYKYFIYHENWEGKLTWSGKKHTVKFREKVGEKTYSDVKYSKNFESPEKAFKYAKKKAKEIGD